MSEKDAYEFLAKRTEGRLATCDRAGQPFITPVNHLFHEGKLYFHGKLTGRKLDNIAENNRVCFEVSEVEKITVSHDRPCGCSTRYSSVLVFGAARVIPDGASKTALLNRLVARHAGGKAFEPVEESHAAGSAVVEIVISEISGKRNVDPE
jgi:nitroimidazol reductase NimA-like FMN-containing flavoprotein (pyridoxamine 5'-phosphate oxidase superfamily)